MEVKCNRSVVLLVMMALAATLGVVLLFVGCAIPVHTTTDSNAVNWWGMFVFLFYLLAPLPLAMARFCASREVMQEENLKVLFEICYFISACIVVSGFGLPFVLARKSIIDAVSSGLIAGANIFVFSTIYSYFIFFGREEEWDWMNDEL